MQPRARGIRICPALPPRPHATKTPPRRGCSASFPEGDPFLTASGSIERRAAAGKPERQERIPLGILYMISATAVFAASSAISKLLVVTEEDGMLSRVRTLV